MGRGGGDTEIREKDDHDQNNNNNNNNNNNTIEGCDLIFFLILALFHWL